MINAYIALLGAVPVTGLIVLAALSVIAGDYAAKMWSVNGSGLYLVIALTGYFFSGFFYIPTLLREGLIVTSVVWLVLSTAGFLIIGALIFKESLSSIQIIAIFLGIVSILILSLHT